MSDETDLTPKRRDAAPMDDGTLLVRVAGGDPSALGELYDRYGRPVYALGCRMLHDEAAAADITQEVFVKLWRSAARFDPHRGRAGTWIMQMAYSTAADLLRTRPHATPIGSETDLDVADATADMGAQVRSALLRIPPEQRQALELSYFDALSPTEIAGRLGLPLGTVKNRLRLGLDALRQSFLSPLRKDVERRVQLPPR